MEYGAIDEEKIGFWKLIKRDYFTDDAITVIRLYFKTNSIEEKTKTFTVQLRLSGMQLLLPVSLIATFAKAELF